MIGRPLTGRKLSGRALGGRGLSSRSSGGGGASDFVPPPSIVLSASTIAEDASVNDVIGTLSVANGSGTYTFAITADPDSKFQIANDDELQLAATLNYETATSHSVTIEADNGVDDPISRVFTITVTNVLEVTLSALTLDTDEIEEGSAAATVVGALQDVTSGSTLSLIDDAGGRFALSGNNIVAGLVATDYDTATSHNITLRETHADGSNSPRDSVIAITVTDVDEVAPTLSNAAAVEDGATAADLTVDTNEANGTLYWVVTQSATPPSAAQVKAGQNHAGAAADDAGSEAVVGTGEQVAAASGLTAETTYYAHFMHEDAASNQSNVVSSSSFTTEEAATGLWVAEGDSITAEDDPEGENPEGYVRDTAELLDPPMNITNVGVGGSDVDDWLGEIATTIALFDAVTGPKILSIMGGNELTPLSAAAAIEKYIEYVDQVRAAGIMVIGVTTLPRDSTDFNTKRGIVNQWWRDNVGIYCDAVADFDTADHSADADAEDTDLYPDGIHPNETVYAEVRPVMAAALNSLTDADAAAPTVAVLTPLDNATDVDSDLATLTLRFNEIVKFTSTVDIELRLVSDDSVVEAFDETDIGTGIEIGVAGEGHILTINLTDPMAASTAHYVHIANGSIEDLSGNDFAGLTGTTWSFTTGSAIDLTDQLVAYWNLDEASGTRVDSHGSFDLTDNSSVGSGTGVGGSGTAAQFDGSDHLSHAHHADLALGGDRSWAFWANRASGVALITKDGGFGNFEYRIEPVDGANTTFRLLEPDADVIDAVVSPDVTTDTWFFFVCTYNDTSKAMTISRNAGTRVTGTATGDFVVGNGPFNLGARNGGQFLVGKMQCVGVWHRVLTEADETFLYNSGVPRLYGDL